MFCWQETASEMLAKIPVPTAIGAAAAQKIARAPQAARAGADEMTKR